MKKLLVSLFVILGITGYASANLNNGGFKDDCKVISVSEALKMPDNSYVKIQGNIQKKLSNDEYLFKDSTGTITAEIDENKWLGQFVSPSDKVELTGEIEKKFNFIKLDVDTIKKLN